MAQQETDDATEDAPGAVALGSSNCSHDEDADDGAGAIGYQLPLESLAPQTAPRELASFVVIVLHGYGMKNTEMYEWLRRMTADRQHIRFVFPQAPQRLVYDASNSERDIDRGATYCTSWFEYTSDFEGKREDSIDRKSLKESRLLLIQMVEAESARLESYPRGPRLDRIGIVGVSQGGCMAIDLCTHVALRFCVTLVAHKMSGTTGSLRTNWHAINATADEIYPLSWARETLGSALTCDYVDDFHDLGKTAVEVDRLLEQRLDEYLPRGASVSAGSS